MFSTLLTPLIFPILLGLILTASVLVLTHDWRLSFVALGVQYGLAALLLAQIVVWQVVVVKLIVGALVCSIFMLTGRQVNFGRPADSRTPWLPYTALARSFTRLEFPTGFPFRFLATIMIGATAWYLASQPEFTFPGLPVSLNIAGFILIALSLLNLGLTEEPINAGLGLLTGLMGFELLYASVEPSLAIIALLAAVHFGVALAVSYLALLNYPLAPEPSAPETPPPTQPEASSH